MSGLNDVLDLVVHLSVVGVVLLVVIVVGRVVKVTGLVGYVILDSKLKNILKKLDFFRQEKFNFFISFI